MKPLISTIFRYSNELEKLLASLQPIALLGARFYLAWIFFSAGLTKIRDWESTLFLFEEEYNVPLLSPGIAAYMGTGGELVLPVLLAAGLLTPVGAIGLSILNLVAVLSLEEIAPAALMQHIFWGALLATLVLFGAGRWSVDRWIYASLTARPAVASHP